MSCTPPLACKCQSHQRPVILSMGRVYGTAACPAVTCLRLRRHACTADLSVAGE